jgi:hypothetical protein
MDDIQFRSLDMDRINITEYYEVEYWSKQFGLHPSVFRKLVEDTGITSAKALREYLHKSFGVSAA